MYKTRRSALNLVLACLLFLTGCQAVLPVLTQLALSFGQDLLAAASANYTPRYALQVEKLLAVLATESTGLAFQPQLAQSGFQNEAPRYQQQYQQRQQRQQARQNSSGYPQYQNPQYQNPQYQLPQNQQPQYQQPQYQEPQYQEPQYQEQYPGTTTNDDPYGDSSYDSTSYDNSSYDDDPYGQEYDNSSYDDDPYGQAYDDSSYNDDPYAEVASTDEQDPYSDEYYSNNQYRGVRSAITMDVAILAQKQGSSGLTVVEDGDILYDGKGVPNNGDKIKIHFKTNCQCYVYIIGIDATGYVAKIFPDEEESLTNPVGGNVNHRIPQGNSWWALDDQPGLEHIFFIASRSPRPDIEDAVAQLAGQPRTNQPFRIQAVTQPAIVPTRGLIKTKGEPTQLAAMATFSPQQFSNQISGADLIVTRWFQHK
ncbi:MAG: DUF4384 domain-containing protein [Gammaproteobacteria bacterium]|nr:DUF4384 domain-containing protein [Gammaproteobacteria bacterium]